MWTNYVSPELVCAACGWFAAQFLKAIINLITDKGISWRIIFASGGMPSSHSATVTSLALSIGLLHGFNSTYFAIAFIVAFIVMYDAMGVRRETGDQAKVLNIIVTLFESQGHSFDMDRDFKELVGHTPFQVYCGCLLGALISLLFVFVIL